MAQHDYSIANQGFPATRADLNNALSAIATNNSGTSAPSTQYAGQFWIDTTSSTWTLYIHDGADDIQFATIDTSANTVNFIDSELGDNSVTTAKIADANVTSAKLSYPLTTFSSTGIDDNATSTALTINSANDASFVGTVTADEFNFSTSGDLHTGTTASSVSIAGGTDSNVGANVTFYGSTHASLANVVRFRVNSTETMRITSGGLIGIGTSSPAPAVGSDTVLEIAGSVSPGLVINDTGQAQKYQLYADSTKFKMSYGATGFFTYDASNGNLGIGTSSPSYKFHAVDTANGNYTARIQNNHASFPYALNLKFDASPDNSASSAFMICNDATSNRMIVWSDGDLDNHDNSYGAISDERIKQDIRDSNSQWNDIKNIRVRNFKKKDDIRQYGENAKEQIGVISQELEQISPKLVKLTNPTSSDILSDASFGTLYQEGDEIPEGKEIGDVKEIFEQVKRVNYSVLYMKAVKALQEAMERIETLEAKVTQLENK